MPDDTNRSEAVHVPQMHGEAGFEEDGVGPLRATGILSLLLGLLSVVCLLGTQLVFFPILAVIFGLIALRPYTGGTPVGRKAAMAGIIFAVGFGGCGVGLAKFRQDTLGNQAAYFAEQFLQLMAQNENELVCESLRTYQHRVKDSLPLKQHYQQDGERRKMLEGYVEKNPVRKLIMELEPDAVWRRDHPVRIYQKLGFDHVQVVLSTGSEEEPLQIAVELEHSVDETNGVGHWKIYSCQPAYIAIHAKSIL